VTLYRRKFCVHPLLWSASMTVRWRSDTVVSLTMFDHHRSWCERCTLKPVFHCAWNCYWNRHGKCGYFSVPYSTTSIAWRFVPRDAMLAPYMPQSCVCLSVTSQCSTETAKRRITQTTPHDSPETLVFDGCWRSRQNSKWVSLNGGAKCRWGRLRLATFDKSLAITQ